MVKDLFADAGAVGDMDSTPGSGRSPGGGSSNPLQYSCLENPMDRGAWRATVHAVAESNTAEQLNNHQPSSFQAIYAGCQGSADCHPPHTPDTHALHLHTHMPHTCAQRIT